MAPNKQILYSGKLALLVICVELVTTIEAQWAIDDDGCRTPNRGVGTCIPIKECRPIIDFIQASSPLTQREIEVLRGYQCGFIGNSIKVCCPEIPIIITPIAKEPTMVSLPPDVTSHRNLNLLPYQCGIQFGESRITGGNKTVLFEFPWMALLSYETGRGLDFRCGGTVINNRYILTAAHCITNLATLRLVGVRLGEYNITSPVDCEKEPFGDEYCASPVQDILVAESIPHPKYNTTSFANDIGLLRLASPINTSVDSVKPICLPTTEEVRNKDFGNTNLTVTGWGTTETGQKSPDLLKVDIPVATEEKCRKAYEKTNVAVNYKHICAGGQNRIDSCGGDSGGPLQTSLSYNEDVRYMQFGIVSFGPRFCGQEGFPGVYTRVEYYMDWVLDNLRP